MSGAAAPVFRRARIADVAAIVELLADDRLGRARETLSRPLDPAYAGAFRAIDADPNQLLAVAEIGGRIVGCVQITFLPGLSRRGMWTGLIEGVRVAGPLRGTGLGRRMMAWAIEKCRERGCGLVQLTSDRSRTDAHRFYEGLGFEASHVGMKLMLD